MSIAVVRPGEGDLLSAGPIRLRILEAGDRTWHRLGIVEVTLAPHTPGPPQHIHREHDETFYVISGRPSFTSGNDAFTAGIGQLIVAGAGTPHTFANPGDETAVLYCTVTPDRYIDYFRELDRLPKGPGGLDPKVVAGIMARYATEVAQPGA
ncbi:MAG: cupin domain-containing protein [Actinomycetota bacterium]|jgi:mannose-6-phosphate isomerase-like protein (cupin superfamily)|nr:cupin domain-containing protein [Actinomycetota bacterium]